MGYIPNQGFAVKMVCEELNPVRNYTKANEPVYLDSAMEVFICFGSSIADGKEKPCYLNFEMNANGAMLASFGCERTNRQNLSEELRSEILCVPSILKDSWNLSLWIPNHIIYKLYQREQRMCLFSERIEPGFHFLCNFFKIKESKGENQHFASFSPIHYPTPDFHLPEYFSEAYIL